MPARCANISLWRYLVVAMVAYSKASATVCETLRLASVDKFRI